MPWTYARRRGDATEVVSPDGIPHSSGDRRILPGLAIGREGHYPNRMTSIPWYRRLVSRTRQPIGFLHVPKAAGTSLTSALAKSIGAPVCHVRFDRSLFGEFTGFDELTTEVRSAIATSEEELWPLASTALVAGHFYLSTIARFVAHSRILLIVREPRARLLSQYDYWRSQSPEETEHWLPYDFPLAAREPFKLFLQNSRIAASSDNVLCRMILGPATHIPLGTFLPETEHASLAEQALSRIQSLGCVQVVERGRAAFDEVGRAFHLRLHVGRENTTRRARRFEHHEFDEETLELLRARTAADSLVYRELALRAFGNTSDAAEACDQAFAERLNALRGAP